MSTPPVPTPFSFPQARAACDWLVAALVAGNLAWTMVCLGGYRPETMVLSWILTGLSLTVFFAGLALDSHRPRLHPAGWLVLPFLGYAAINVMAITPVEWLGWTDWLNWACFTASLWIGLNVLRRTGPRRLVHGTLALLGVVGVALALHQRLVDEHWMMLGRTQTRQFVGRASGFFGIPNSFAALMLLLFFPALAAALGTGARRLGVRCLAGAVAAIYLAGLVLTVSRGAWLTLAGVFAVWPLFASGRGWTWRVGGVTLALLLVSGLGWGLYTTLPEVKLRFDTLIADGGEVTRPTMWRGAWDLFQDEPLTGTGAGSYNVLFERHRPIHFRDEPQWAHNDYLNTLSDYGAVGFVLFFGAIAGMIVLGLRDRAGPPPVGAKPDAVTLGIAMGLLAFGVSLLLDFHLKIPALMMAVALALAEWIRRRWPADHEVSVTPQGRVGAAAMMVAMPVFVAAFVLPHQRAESVRYPARRALDGVAERRADLAEEREILARARTAFDAAVALDPENAQAWSDVSYARSLQARHAPGDIVLLGVEAEAAARQALALSEAVPEFWWRLGIALDMQGKWAEGGEAFARAVKIAPHSASAWYHQAYHLSLKSSTRLIARVAAATCLRLDPGHRSAEDLLRSLATPP